MVRLVRAAAKVADAHLGNYAIIGGVAVSARLGQAHRATADIDTVVDQTENVRATVPVATPGALFSMKLHAIQDRRANGGLNKRAGDAWDMKLRQTGCSHRKLARGR